MPRKRIPFTEEDLTLLKALVGDVRPIPWKDIAHALGRSIRECRETYSHNWGPIYKDWTREEDETISREIANGGKVWMLEISLPGRTKSAIKNRWARLKFMANPIEKLKIQPENLPEEEDVWAL
jgi:hypothetical protein